MAVRCALPVVTTIVIVAMVTICGDAFGDSPGSDSCASSPNKRGFTREAALTGDWGGVRSGLAERGVTITASYAPELFAAPELERDRAVVAGLGALALDVDLASLLGPMVGTVHIAGFAIHGRGLSTQLMDLYGVSNNVAPADVRLFEAWLDRSFGPLAVRAGLLAADQQFTLARHSAVLINSTFGIPGIASYNVTGPVYPVASPGASATLTLGDLVARAAVYDGDRVNSHGVPTAIGTELLGFGELEYVGTFKLGGWHHSALGDGVYAVVDRQLDRYLGAFARLAASSGPLDSYGDAGIRIGPGPLRPRDFASLAIAFARTDAAGSQTIIETTYQYLAAGWLTLQPDAQLLFDRAGTHVIMAVRAVIAL